MYKIVHMRFINDEYVEFGIYLRECSPHLHRRQFELEFCIFIFFFLLFFINSKHFVIFSFFF